MKEEGIENWKRRFFLEIENIGKRRSRVSFTEAFLASRFLRDKRGGFSLWEWWWGVWKSVNEPHCNPAFAFKWCSIWIVFCSN